MSDLQSLVRHCIAGLNTIGVEPETVIEWHRKGWQFVSYPRSVQKGGRRCSVAIPAIGLTSQVSAAAGFGGRSRVAANREPGFRDQRLSIPSLPVPRHRLLSGSVLEQG